MEYLLLLMALLFLADVYPESGLLCQQTAIIPVFQDLCVGIPPFTLFVVYFTGVYADEEYYC